MTEKNINASLKPSEHSQRVRTIDLQNIFFLYFPQDQSTPNKQHYQGLSLAN